MTKLPQSIDGVLIELDKIIETSIKNSDYLAIFAYVYRRTTAQIKAEIIAGNFEDNERMEKLDVTFANRYLDAYDRFKSHKNPSASWLISFDARLQKLTIMQHLLLGMSAHINFDLGIAAAQVAQGQYIKTFKNDFMKVNDILAQLTNEMQFRVARASRLMFLLDWVGGRSDERIANFSIKKARQFAWKVATTLAVLDDESKNLAIEKFDNEIAKFNQKILSPPGNILNTILKVIGFFEENNTEKIVENLRAE